MVTKIRDGKVFLEPKTPVDIETGAVLCQLYCWDPIAVDWVPYQQPGSSGGGGGLTDTQLRASTVGVSVGNWPAGFQVIGNVEVVNDVGNSLPVSGTFWQATQPVSGTFWQATQPISESHLPNLDLSLSALRDALRGGSTASPTITVTNAYIELVRSN